MLPKTSLLIMLLLCTFLAASHASWTLNSTHEEVKMLNTSNVAITCKWDSLSITSLENLTSHPPDFNSVANILIKKMDPEVNNAILAAVTFGGDNHISKITIKPQDPNIEVTSSPNSLHNPFLKVKWIIASESTVGTFGCIVSGFDKNREFTTYQVPATKIEKKDFTIKDVFDIVNAAKAEIFTTFKMFESKEKAEINKLKSENKNLRKFISSELDRLRTDINISYSTLGSEIANVSRYAAEVYATKDHLDTALLSLENLTLTKINDETLKNKITHDNIYAAIRGVDKNAKDMYLKLDLALQNMSNLAINEFQDLKNVCIDNAKQTSSSINKIENKMSEMANDTLELKYCLRYELFEGECRNQTMALFPEYVPTTSTTPMTTTTQLVTRPTSSSIWPDGGYVFLTEKICPSAGQSFVYQKMKSRQFIDTSGLNYTTWELNYLDRNQSIFYGDLFFCVKSSATKNNGFEWPIGKYCLASRRDRCPKHLIQSHISYHTRAGGFLLLRFCCETTGNASVPMKLPNKHTFNLFR